MVSSEYDHRPLICLREGESPDELLESTLGRPTGGRVSRRAVFLIRLSRPTGGRVGIEPL